ncbi:hypothetical protein [Treponema sp.]|uniref:hypothetical protein n=1 Tax=Treponema sp. TaxID=166 RepID=UPI00388D3C66
MNIVKITSDSITLSSGLNQDSFAKTNTASLLSVKNIYLHFKDGTFTSKDYIFDTTETDENKNVYFKGKKINGSLLSEILEKAFNSRTENDIFAIQVFCKAIDFLYSQNQHIQISGAGGIIIDSDLQSKTAELLFLSYELFEECASHFKESYASIQGKYLYKGLHEKSGLLFLRGTVLYKAFTSRFPYEENDTTKRQEDIYDENFIPLKFWNSSIADFISESIDSSLKLKPDLKFTAGKRTLTDSSAQKNQRKLLERASKIDNNLVGELLKKAPDFSENQSERTRFIKKADRKIKVKRFLRRNKNRILTGIAAAFVILWFISGWLEQNSKLITTKGLTSTQTTAALYTMIHRADVPNLQEILSGKETKDLILKVSSFYVSAKQRLETSPDNGSLTPERWFFYKKSSKSWMYGITNLKIDGKEYPSENKYAIKKDKPEILDSEDGKILKKGDKITHTAEYFLVHQMEARFVIEKMSDTVTLLWNGKHWNVVKVEGKAKSESVKSKEFIEEYYSSLETSEIKPAVDSLKKKYSWIPAEIDMKAAAEFLAEKYDSVEAKKYLAE